MNITEKDIENWNKLGNEENVADYTDRSDPSYSSSRDYHDIAQKNRNTNWKKESDYYNAKYKPKTREYTDNELEEMESKILSSTTSELFNSHKSSMEDMSNTVDSAYEDTYTDKYHDKVLEDIEENRRRLNGEK